MAAIRMSLHVQCSVRQYAPKVLRSGIPTHHPRAIYKGLRGFTQFLSTHPNLSVLLHTLALLHARFGLHKIVPCSLNATRLSLYAAQVSVNSTTLKTGRPLRLAGIGFEIRRFLPAWEVPSSIN